jgi:hypothetical protein
MGRPCGMGGAVEAWVKSRELIMNSVFLYRINKRFYAIYSAVLIQNQ